jgi:hypothetical protein
MPKLTSRRTEGMEQLPGHLPATKRSIARWYAAALAALAQNRPLSTAAAPSSNLMMRCGN